MTEEVADVMLLGAGFEKTASKLTPQVVEAQAGDARAVARRIPRGLDRFDRLAAFSVRTRPGYQAK